MKTKEISLPQANYQGYIWFSDRSNPEIIDGDFCLEVSQDSDPFIAEAYLLDMEKHISHSIKFVDGEYLFNSFQLGKEDYTDYKVYEGNRMEGRGLRFSQRWKTVQDELCCGMETQVPAEMVFVGFDKD